MSLETLLPAIVCGLIAWGGVRVELRWLHADVKRQEERINRLETLKLSKENQS